MKLTQKEIDDICNEIDAIWSTPQCGFVFTTCTTCLKPRKCFTSILDLSSTCSECYKKRKIEEEESRRMNDSLKDFAKL